MTIKFTNNANDTLIYTLNKLALFTIEGDFVNKGFPANCVIADANEEGLRIYEADETGKALKYSSWIIPFEDINSITVI